MKIFFLSLLLSALIHLPVRAQVNAELATLEQQINDSLQSQQGFFAVAFLNLGTGEKISIHAHDHFHAASTMKTPVLVATYHQIKKHRLSLTDSVEIRNEFHSIVDGSTYSLDSAADSEKTLYNRIGEKTTVRELLYLMITLSSNFATNMVVELVHAKEVMKIMHKLGVKEMEVLRGVEDQKAFDKGLNNTTTAYDLGLLFEKIAEGKAVNKQFSDAMIQTLLDQQFNEIIPGRLPTGVKVAHKTGWITGVHHDGGIVYCATGKKYVLVLLSKNLQNEQSAIRMMSNISLLIYQYVNRPPDEKQANKVQPGLLP